jgi:hypothetical protein
LSREVRSRAQVVTERPCNSVQLRIYGFRSDNSPRLSSDSATSALWMIVMWIVRMNTLSKYKLYFAFICGSLTTLLVAQAVGLQLQTVG